MMDETSPVAMITPSVPSVMHPDEILRIDRLRVKLRRGAEHGAPAAETPVSVCTPGAAEESSISFCVREKEIFAITGGSGSGKSTLACAVTGLLPADAYHIEGRAFFRGGDLLAATAEERRAVLRSKIRYVLQEPGQSFNPIALVGTQVGYAFDDTEDHRERFRTLLSSFGLADHRALMRSYPHQLSIGTLQRILLAMALATKPALLIADEPTSAIDFILKHALMEKLRLLCEEGMCAMIITHDLPLARRYARRVSLLAGGILQEVR